MEHKGFSLADLNNFVKLLNTIIELTRTEYSKYKSLLNINRREENILAMVPKNTKFMIRKNWFGVLNFVLKIPVDCSVFAPLLIRQKYK